MTHARRTVVGALVVAVLAAGVWLFTLGPAGGSAPPRADPAPAARVSAPPLSSDPVSSAIAAAQAALKTHPDNYQTWAELGLAYVQQAKATVNPSYYPKAEGAVARSLALNTRDNYEGYGAKAALKAAEHDFTAARDAALTGIRINGYNSTLYGALGDAYTQLGQYARAAAAVEKMNELLPGVPAFTRASYVLELRGDIAGSRAALERALTASTSASDIAFSQYYLGESALNYGGDAAGALTHYEAGLAVSPGDFTLLAGRARAEAALGRTSAALADYTKVVGAVPQPQFVLELAELQDSLHRSDAARQYSLFRTEEQLFQANGVTLDVESALFEADHGSPVKALQLAAAGWKVRPFLEMADAYAWAMYVNHRYPEALAWSKRASVTGWPNALFLYHRGMIEKAMGSRSAAKSDLARCLELNPHFNVLQAPIAAEALKQIS